MDGDDWLVERFEGLVAVLDPDIVLRLDGGAARHLGVERRPVS